MSPLPLELLGRLARPSTRAAAADELARRLGCELALVLVPDPQLGTLLPALHLPQRLHQASRWRALAAEAKRGAPARAALSREAGTPPAETVAHALPGGGALVLHGGAPGEVPDDWLDAMALLTPGFTAELGGRALEGAAELARRSAEQAEHSAAALASAQLELERHMRELRESDRRKDEFLAMLGHELRNPLAPLLTSLSLLRRFTDKPQPSRYIDMAERQVRSLARIVDDLLDVSRITRGKLELRCERLELGQLAARVVETLTPHAERHGLRLELTRPEVELFVDADAVRVEQVLVNLVNNAVKFTPHGGRIDVALAAAEEEVALAVHDTGAGMDSALLEQAFEPFVQGEHTLARSAGGLGIGLTLVRGLVQLHGGSVSAASAGPGRGSSFHVRLPRAAAPPARIESAQALAGDVHLLDILVVDDNVDAASMLGELLRAWGHRVVVEHEATAALALLERDRFDVAILDIGLPKLSGWDLARSVRSHAGVRPYMVALSGYGSADDAGRSSQAGFDVHLVKPVQPEPLRELLSSLGGVRQAG